MNRNNIIAIAILAFLIVIQSAVFSQKTNLDISLSKADSVYADGLPVLQLPENYKQQIALPSDLDNSTLPYMRPSFNQQSYWNCGQCAGVAYNFTYEINLAREAIGDWIVNQYSQNFTFNFMNMGSTYGVSYFNSFEAIKACGNPNLEDYGGMYSAFGTGWKSSYSLYENAMKNRIVDVYAIDVGTPEGLETLKYWLLNHMDGSQYGGLANFYFGWGLTGSLPQESPDAGFQVVLESHTIATHAMTIVGFNDSVRFDVNNDGKFTNDIDLNDDGILDMKDWEIGAVKYINSTTFNDGIGYMMYRTLALESGQGGIWNQQVHVIKVDADYIPTASVRVKLNHNSREKIKLIAGVSTNLDDNYPQHTLDFPIFNFQGGDNYMQGLGLDESYKNIELALDISPLFSYIDDGEEAKFFIQVVENDEDNSGEGQILHYSLVMGLDTLNEIVCQQVPLEIVNNAITTLQLSHTSSNNKVTITTNELPKVETGILSEFQMEAQGGNPPYIWSIENHYSLNEIHNNFQNISESKLEFENNQEGSTIVQLPFGFPYYGDTIDQITVFIDGFIMFDETPYPYPYFKGEESIIKNNRMIAPFISNLLLIGEDGVWIDSNDERIIIRWKATCGYSWSNEVNFSLILNKDGLIETHYGLMEYTDAKHWGAGISDGDKSNYTLLNNNQNHKELINSSFSYVKPQLTPKILTINETGLLSLMIAEPNNNYPIVVQVKDRHGIIDSKVYNQTSSKFNIVYTVNENDRFVNYNEVSAIDIDIVNTSNIDYNNAIIKFHSSDEFMILSDSVIQVGVIEAGQSLKINEAATFSFISNVPDRYNSTIKCELIAENEILNSTITTTVNAPKFRFLTKQILDGEDGVLYPGETSIVKLTLQNTGHAKSSNAFAVLGSDYDKIYVDFEKQDIAELNPGDTMIVYYTVAAKFTVPLGTLVPLDLYIYVNNKVYDQMTSDIRIGHIPVLIIDKDPDMASGIELKSLFDDLGLQNTLSSELNVNLDDYLSIFISLGGLFNNYTLTEKESEQLVNFLNSSGNIYMEGRATWNNSQFLPIVNMFNIRAEDPSYFYPLDTAIGVNEDYTKNLLFTVVAETPYINYFIHPEEDAFTLLKTQTNDSSDIAIAHDNGNYKTIGSSILISSLVDTDDISTRNNYLLGILKFFDLEKYIYVNLPEDLVSIPKLEMDLFPNPASNSVTFNITNQLYSNSLIQVLNLSGMVVYEKNISATESTKNSTITWDCTGFGGTRVMSGLYLIRFISGNQTITRKLIIK